MANGASDDRGEGVEGCGVGANGGDVAAARGGKEAGGGDMLFISRG
jgi:hypothetical protein